MHVRVNVACPRDERTGCLSQLGPRGLSCGTTWTDGLGAPARLLVHAGRHAVPARARSGIQQVDAARGATVGTGLQTLGWAETGARAAPCSCACGLKRSEGGREPVVYNGANRILPRELRVLGGGVRKGLSQLPTPWGRREGEGRRSPSIGRRVFLGEGSFQALPKVVRVILVHAAHAALKVRRNLLAAVQDLRATRGACGA